jgi:hypothetical protein
VQIAHREGEERAIGGEAGAEQSSAGLDARHLQNVLEKPRRHVQHGDRLAHEWQRRQQPLERFRIAGNREVTRFAPRSDAQLWQVRGQPLLQLTGPARSEQGRPRRPATDVDQQARTIWLRPSAGERRGCRPRSIRGTNCRGEDDAPLHRPAGLA